MPRPKGRPRDYREHLRLLGDIMVLAFRLDLTRVVSFMFGWTASNTNSLSMDPLGTVAGTASAVFGFLQTIGGALIGMIIGRAFNGSVTPLAAGYFIVGSASLIAILIAEKGKLFGVGEDYEELPKP